MYMLCASFRKLYVIAMGLFFRTQRSKFIEMYGRTTSLRAVCTSGANVQQTDRPLDEFDITKMKSYKTSYEYDPLYFQDFIL